MEYLGQIRTNAKLLRFTYSLFRYVDTGRLITVYEEDFKRELDLIKDCRINGYNKTITLSNTVYVIPKVCYNELVKVIEDIELNKNHIMKEVVKSKLLGTELDFYFVLKDKIGFNGYVVTYPSDDEDICTNYYAVTQINDYDCALRIDIKDAIRIIGVQCLTRKYTQEAIQSTIKNKDRFGYLINDSNFENLCAELRRNCVSINSKVYLVKDEYVIVNDKTSGFRKFLVRDMVFQPSKFDDFDFTESGAIDISDWVQTYMFSKG